ncbi:hypothetical protein [Nocardia sp. NPDC047654]|uniref:hypothetical protein n=1 Tax=Nocardia sp. NPDC047654 TaxID=3364314 RepID=UPI00371BDA0D
MTVVDGGAEVLDAGELDDRRQAARVIVTDAAVESVEKDIHGPVGSLNDSLGENTSGRRHLDSSAEINATGRSPS